MIDRRTLLAGLASLPLAASAACAQAQTPAPASGPLRTVRISGANVEVPVIGIGTARRYADPADAAALDPLRATIARFAELGGTVIDTAPSYGRAEEVVGQLVAELGIRDRLFLATKVGGDNAAEEIAQSFRNLRTEVIDLIALHNLRDIPNRLAILRELKAQGRLRSIGASISSRAGFGPTEAAIAAQPEQYAAFETLMRGERLDVIQVDYALDNRGAAERILPLAQEQGLAVMNNLPFGRGRLFQATQGRPLPDWAAEIGATSWAQVFLKYVLSHPSNPIAIPGMAQTRYIDDNLGAARGTLPDAALRTRMEQFIDGL